MPKLYLVGITEDRTGLVLAKSPRAKSGDSVVEVDNDLLDAIAEIRRYRSEGALPPPISSPALPTRHRPTGEGPSESTLSPREIQSRLRRGESVQSVARRAGVETWRIEVYAAPIAAEQARIVSRARELEVEKRGAGRSGRPLGESVQANIVEKKVSMNVDEFESAWSAYEPEPDRWVVQFRYTSRGRDQMAEWLYEPEDDEITPNNRLATQLGWRDPKRPGRLPPLPEAPREAASTKKKSTKKKTAKKPAKKSSKKKTAKKPAKKQAPAKKKSTKKPAKKSSKKKTAKKPAKKKTAKKKAPAKKKSAKKSAKKKSKSKKSSGKRSKSPPASRAVGAAAGEDDAGTSGRHWRDELARKVAEDRAAGEASGSWRVVPNGDADQAASDDLDPPSWLHEGGSRDDDGPLDVDGDEEEIVVDGRRGRSHVRVVGTPASEEANRTRESEPPDEEPPPDRRPEPRRRRGLFRRGRDGA